jgi:serine/threonine-protein kinase RsbW
MVEKTDWQPNFLVYLSETATFSANLKSLRAMIHWIRLRLNSLGLDETNLRKAELASEEVLVNIIKHGYKKQTGKIEIELQMLHSHIEILFRDYGPPFNPLEREISFNPFATLEERRPGGLGILFIRQYMDEVRYRREKNANVLMLIQKFTDSSRLK